MDTSEVIAKLALFTTGNGGIESLGSRQTDPLVLDRLASLNKEPLSKVQLNQLLGLAHERAVSDGFFKYYWLAQPKCPYNLSSIPGFSSQYPDHTKIQGIDHFTFGLYRIFVDGLLYQGNVRTFYRNWSNRSFEEIDAFVTSNLIDTKGAKDRGPIMPLQHIAKDSRYLISEMACKSYGETPRTESDLRSALLSAWEEHAKNGGTRVSVKDLLTGVAKNPTYANKQLALTFSAVEIIDEFVESAQDIEDRYGRVADTFLSARASALVNTKLYLSLVNDLDVYVATSMRSRQDFRTMSDRCDQIFGHAKVQDLHLRYFDPTLSAAEGHQDKGLIECLMVKCAKVLVYCAGEKESYGKDAEAAMALSLGKPVIFLCDEEQKRSFYKEVHPLSRLINFSTGVAVGAMVTSHVECVSDLLDRLFDNEMEYELKHHPDRPGYLQLVEKLTESVVRLQTNDKMLSEAFWNYYKSQQ